jgi:penicillin-binding protein 1C
MRDNWCIGYSRRYTVGVWVGNFSGEPMRDVSGITGAAPVWLDIMTWLHRTTPSPPPEPPSGVIAKEVGFPRRIERNRVEWFLAGTEPSPVGLTLAGDHPRILVPARGTVIALDPDIPPSQQRVVLEAQSGRAPLRWVLNGTDLGSGADVVVWSPRPGRHTLSLVDTEGRPRDTLTFEVRGLGARSLN